MLRSPPVPAPGELTEPSGFVYLAHRVPNAVATKVTALNLTGINLIPESQRVEPDGQLALPGGGDDGMERERAPPASSTSTSNCWPAGPGTENLLEAPPAAWLLPGNGTTSVAPSPVPAWS